MKVKKDGIIKGALTLGVGTFVAKVLGALYRVPLTNLIGSYGMGLYQTVFPVYALLLDFSGAGAPTALSKIISSYKGENKEEYAYQYLQSALRLFCAIGVLLTFGMAIFSKAFAILQGDENAFLAYICLSPAVLFVCIISCYRGYFQGLMKMSPTAYSQILEQVIKLSLGLLLAFFFYPNITLAVAGATLAIACSELITVLYLFILYRRRIRVNSLVLKYKNQEFKANSKKIIKVSLPIVLMGVMLPLSHVIDSFLIANILNGYLENGTALYGILSGMVNTVINLPVAICYGLASVTVPSISSSHNSLEAEKRIEKSLLLTILVGVPSAIMCYLFAPLIIKVLYGRLSIVDRGVAVSLLKLCSPSILLLSLVQTSNAILIGKNKLYYPTLSLGVGIIVKIVVSVTLIKNPEINIYGGAIGLIACYFSACLINLIMIINLRTKNENSTRCIRQPAN